MKKAVAYLFLLSCVVSMSSCMQDTKSAEKQLDSLALAAWEAEAEITGIETSDWKKLCTEAKQNMEFITFNFKDTMNRETALALDKYARAAKTLEGFVNDFEAITQQVSLAAGQVTKLKEDFTKQARPLDSITNYIARETKNLAVLNKSVEAKTDYARQQVEIIQQNTPEVDKVMEQLKNDE